MWQGAGSAGEQHPARMQGAQEGRTPQQAAGEVIWAETLTMVLLLLRCGAGGKALGKRTFFGESGGDLLLRCCCLERAQPDSSPKGEERRGSTTFAPRSPPIRLIKALLAETSKAQSPHLGVISPSASSPATLPDAPYLLSPSPETRRASPAPPAGGRDGCPRRDSLPVISPALICRREF